jgi:hypothetical protein
VPVTSHGAREDAVVEDQRPTEFRQNDRTFRRTKMCDETALPDTILQLRPTALPQAEALRPHKK